MKQIFYVHVEKGIVQFSDLEEGMKLKQMLNDKGIKARVRMRTPYSKKGKSITGLH